MGDKECSGQTSGLPNSDLSSGAGCEVFRPVCLLLGASGACVVLQNSQQSYQTLGPKTTLCLGLSLIHVPQLVCISVMRREHRHQWVEKEAQGQSLPCHASRRADHMQLRRGEVTATTRGDLSFTPFPRASRKSVSEDGDLSVEEQAGELRFQIPTQQFLIFSIDSPFPTQKGLKTKTKPRGGP
ncbi:hypothetical protein P7K49_018642 [Saguinus oedipus]|uniref:Uncharacterized protein n=1 Tax=Saguinus oedipus TaxID=9490 RepID=A0ABQ9V5X9_SAGOE|nr:hypothetical protein P7K49_018642 [Saguinus oedipus]